MKAPAKINLGLTVLGRRADGFHNIESVMQQVSLSDILVLEESQERGYSFHCNVPGLSGPDNLVCKAADALYSAAAGSLPGVKIMLYKNIPVEAGLGGGSSDAASLLLGLNRYLQLELPLERLLQIGADLGSDIPYCMTGGTALVGGQGEDVEPLPSLPFYWVVLAVPEGASISTAEAYKAFDQTLMGRPSLARLIKYIRQGDRAGILKWLENDFTNTLETSDLPGTRQAQKLKEQFRSLGLYAVFSGSGPSLFVLTDSYKHACSALKVANQEKARTYLCWTKDPKRSDSYV